MMKAILTASAALSFFAIGLFQLFAIMDGVQYYLGVGGFISFVIAGFTTYIPLLGIFLGVVGAMNAWGWSFFSAALLFGFPLLLGIAASLLGGFAEYTQNRRR
jgi:hypothetical protein